MANVAVFILYELPNMNSAVYHASFSPCTADNACRGQSRAEWSWITAMFLTAAGTTSSGNMLFLAIFAQERRGRLRALLYLGFCFAAMMLQTAMTLLFGTAV